MARGRRLLVRGRLVSHDRADPAVLGERGLPAAELSAIVEEAKAEMAAARKEANEAAWPQPAVAYEDVQDTGAVAWSK